MIKTCMKCFKLHDEREKCAEVELDSDAKKWADLLSKSKEIKVAAGVIPDKKDMVEHKIAKSSRHGVYADPEKRRAYRREWMRKQREQIRHT